MLHTHQIHLRRSIGPLVAIFAAFPLNAQTPPCPAGATPPYICTSQYDNMRDGYNGSETILTTSLVSGGLSQPSWSPLTVDQDSSVLPIGFASNPVYGQPLYVPGVTLTGNTSCAAGAPWTCNMVVAGTLAGSIWAWNADTGGVLWKRVGTAGTPGTNYLWRDDCLSGGGVSVASVGGTGSVPFAGIVSTPVIDANASPVMYVTSVCQTSTPAVQWWLHKIDLTTGTDISTIQIGATVGGTAGADDDISGVITFPAGEVLQRAALLEVRNTNATPGTLVYVAFGSANNETPAIPPQTRPYKYHGWLFAYYTNANGVLAQYINFNSSGLGCGTPPQNNDYYNYNCGGNSASPACDCQIELLPGGTTGYFQGAPNWGGHGSGIWMFSRGPASNTLGTGTSAVSHVYATTGNGGFQRYSGSAPYTQPFNLGSSILDFTMSSSGIDGHSGTSPGQTFTPSGGAAFSPPLTQTPIFPHFPGTTCSGGGSCAYTFQSMNENDWDMGPITLFKDTINNKNWLVSVDKSGYGYLLPQGAFCSPAPCQAFGSGDNPNWPFAAAFTPCWNILGGASECDRVTSLAFYNNELYFWPSKERLTAFAISDNSTPQTGAGTVTVLSAHPQNVYGCSTPPCSPSCASPGATCFTDELVPGDTITIGSQTATVTSVGSDAFLTVNSSLSPASGASFTYRGYLINPARDTTPVGNIVDYPGGAVVVTSNGGSNGIVWALATVSQVASLYAYNATPTLSGNARYLPKLWNSSDSTFSLLSPAGATFALLTVVNGAVYVPTYSISISGATVSGLLVYCVTGAPACGS